MAGKLGNLFISLSRAAMPFTFSLFLYFFDPFTVFDFYSLFFEITKNSNLKIPIRIGRLFYQANTITFMLNGDGRAAFPILFPPVGQPLFCFDLSSLVVVLCNARGRVDQGRIRGHWCGGGCADEVVPSVNLAIDLNSVFINDLSFPPAYPIPSWFFLRWFIVSANCSWTTFLLSFAGFTSTIFLRLIVG